MRHIWRFFFATAGWRALSFSRPFLLDPLFLPPCDIRRSKRVDTHKPDGGGWKIRVVRVQKNYRLLSCAVREECGVTTIRLVLEEHRTGGTGLYWWRSEKMHHHKRAAPSYHWEGFGRKNTKPPWFNCRLFDKDRRDVGWVVKDFGRPPSQVGA